MNRNCNCEDCKFANWDFSIFPEDAYLRLNSIEIPEQFDLYCSVFNRFFLEHETPCDCKYVTYGENNYHEICKKYYSQLSLEKNKLKKNKEKLSKKFI